MLVRYLPLQTPLDELRNRDLERLTYEAGRLELLIAERDTKGIVRTATVTFTKIVAFEVFDESWSGWIDREGEDDQAAIRVLSRSKYLDFVTAAYGYYRDVVGEASHYRVAMDDDIVEVVSREPPIVGQPAGK